MQKREKTNMKNYSITHTSNEGRRELHDELGLSGAEISLNNLPAGANVPFVHAHKNNEEIYFIISGKGHVIIDGETIELTAGDFIKISPEGKRQFFAGNNSPISYLCIQVKKNSLEGYTATDAIMA